MIKNFNGCNWGNQVLPCYYSVEIEPCQSVPSEKKRNCTVTIGSFLKKTLKSVFTILFPLSDKSSDK